jgi:hypothetical protein
MMLLACVYLLPGPAIDKLGTMLTWPARAIATQLELAKHDRAAATQAIAISVGAAFVLGAVGRMIDLPGALPACLIAAGALIAVTVVAALRKQLPQLRAAALGMGVAGALMWAAIALSPVRWDFYRYLGGDLRRRNQPEAALEAYERGERYAPPGSSRSDKIKELKAQLGR